MFTLPAISGNSRYCADSSGIMPLNALNGSSYMYNDESSTLSRPPSYEEAVSSGSMFGLFIVNSGDSCHNSVSHQHAHHDQLDQPPNYHDLLSPTGSTASADKPSNRNNPYVSRDADTAEYLDTSLDNQCTRFSQIEIVGSTSTLTSPVPSPRPHSRKHESKKSDKTKVRTGSSSGWRKHLSSEKSALSVARDRLYRVLSPALSRRSERLESHKKVNLHAMDPGRERKNVHNPSTNDLYASLLLDQSPLGQYTEDLQADQARCSCALHEAKTVRRRKRRHILCACTSLLLVIVVVALIILTTSGLLANPTKTSSDTNMATDATNKLYLTLERPS